MRLLYKTGPMESLRKWFYKPKRDDRSLLAQFFFADDALNMVAAELDSFDGRKDPERCATLVNQLRHAQDRVLNITSQIMDQMLGDERVARGFRVKFPEDVLQDNLAGQLWFGAECLAAGSSIMNREEESTAMRPLARALTRSLEAVRFLLREKCLRPRSWTLWQHDDMLHESLKIFDRLFAEFELCYVSAMVNVKTPHEFEAQQLICVLFSESLRRALQKGLLTQEQVDSYDPALMFAVPRLAIVSGLLIYSSGPLSIDKLPEEMSDMFRPFRTLLHKIRSLLWTLERRELNALERLLCSNEHVGSLSTQRTNIVQTPVDDQYPDIGEFVSRFYADNANCRELYTQSSSEPTICEGDYLPDNIEVMTPIIDGMRRLTEETDNESEQDIENQHTSISSTDTFHDTKDFNNKTRKTSKVENNDLSSLRNLSTNGLMMFDPLVVTTASSENRQLPDNDLVTSLNEQVSEIADRLSSMVTNEVETIIDHSHSFSANDVPTLISSDESESFGFSGTRTEQLSCLPSTSHGYLIPNAISQEPAVLASLSHNNSALFNPDDESIESVAINNDLPLIIPENIDNGVLNTSISITNANLSSLLLTNGEYRSFIDNDEEIHEDNNSFHSANEMRDDGVKFMLGYESDNQDSQIDSGVSTENASLDRSPDTEVKNKDHFMSQNRVLNAEDKNENVLEKSVNIIDENVNIEITQSNDEAGSSMNENNDMNESDNIFKDKSKFQATEEELLTLDEVLAELKKQDEGSNEKVESIRDVSSSSKKKERERRSKRKRSKMWSPSIVIIDSRSLQNQSPLRLDLDRFVDAANPSDPDCTEDEQIALALQAQELVARRHARGKFKSSEDLIHRLFVCIAGVADQLQTNFAADLRNILKSVFLMNQTPEVPESDSSEPEEDKGVTYEGTDNNGGSFDSVYSAEEAYAESTSSSNSNKSLSRRNTVNSTMEQPTTSTEQRRKSVDNLQSVSTGNLATESEIERMPEWVPDIAAPECMRCAAHFTAFRRRHHCRNCGKVFCASCSSNSLPLPRYGQLKPVRVCDECFTSIASNCRRTNSYR